MRILSDNYVENSTGKALTRRDTKYSKEHHFYGETALVKPISTIYKQINGNYTELLPRILTKTILLLTTDEAINTKRILLLDNNEPCDIETSDAMPKGSSRR